LHPPLHPRNQHQRWKITMNSGNWPHAITEMQFCQSLSSSLPQISRSNDSGSA
jgi:hypothetical protein